MKRGKKIEGIEGNWCRTDTGQEAIYSLELFERFIDSIETEPYFWKWAAISLHNSLQNFLVLILQGSDKCGAYCDQDLKKWRTYYQDRKATKPPKNTPKLAPLSILFSRLTKIEKHTHLIKHEENVELLNTIRNDFMHFKLSVMLVEVSGMINISHSVLNIIDDIVSKWGIQIYIDNEETERIAETTKIIRLKLSRLNIIYKSNIPQDTAIE